jgi:hypothetical protein
VQRAPEYLKELEEAQAALLSLLTPAELQALGFGSAGPSSSSPSTPQLHVFWPKYTGGLHSQLDLDEQIKPVDYSVWDQCDKWERYWRTAPPPAKGAIVLPDSLRGNTFRGTFAAAGELPACTQQDVLVTFDQNSNELRGWPGVPEGVGMAILNITEGNPDGFMLVGAHRTPSLVSAFARFMLTLFSSCLLWRCTVSDGYLEYCFRWRSTGGFYASIEVPNRSNSCSAGC